MARTPRTFSRRGHAEAKAGENIGQGKLREDVTEKGISNRSLRIEYSICSNWPRNSFSGAIDGRPALAYIVSNRRDNRASTSSTMVRMARSG